MNTSTPSYMQITKLNGTANYSTWKLRMRTFLIHQGLWYTVTDSAPRPISGAEADYKPEALEDYTKWVINNNKAYTLMLLMSSDTSIQLVQDIVEAKALWEKYSQLYRLTGFSARYNAFNNLCSTSLEASLGMDDYINKVKQYSLQLSEIGDALPDWQIVSIILNNLGSNYDIWAQQMIQKLRESPEISLDSIITQLLNEDLRHQAKESSIALMVKKTQNQKDRISKTFKKCNFCKKKGHLEEHCFIKNPDLYAIFIKNFKKKKEDKEEEEKKKKQKMLFKSNFVRVLELSVRIH